MDDTIDKARFHKYVVGSLWVLKRNSNLLEVPEWSFGTENPMLDTMMTIQSLVTFSEQLKALPESEWPEPRRLPERWVRYIRWLQDQVRKERTDGFVSDDRDYGTDVWAVREFGRMFGHCVVRSERCIEIDVADCFCPLYEDFVDYEMLDDETKRRLEEWWRQPDE